MSRNDIQFFFEGDSYFEALWQDLESAQYSISIEIYILAEDEIGNKLKEILIKKARQGLRIKLLVDALGSMSLSKNFISDLRLAGVKFKRYHPFKLLAPFNKHLNKRNHRKIIIIDSMIGYIGGINFFKFASKNVYGKQRWRDTHIKISGQMVSKLNYYFKRSFKEIKHRSKRFERFSAINDIVATKNYFGKNYIRHFIHRYIRRSRKHIGITSAYFIPDIHTIFTLVRAVKRGVCVQVLTSDPVYCDVPFVHRISRPILRFLIKKGVKVFFYKERMMHAKTIFFDNKISTLGSSNINYRSFFRDLEINVFLRKEKWTLILKEQFNKDIQNSRQVTLAELTDISWFNKAIDVFCYFFRSFF